MFSNLKVAMFCEKVSPDDICNLLSMHRNTVSNKTNGKADFTLTEAQTLHRAFFKHYDFGWLFEREQYQADEENRPA